MNIKLIILAYLSLFAFGLIDNSRGPIYPDILQDLNLSSTLGSQIFALTSLASLVCTILSRYWLPAIGAFKGLRLFLLVFTLGTGLLGLSSRLPSPYMVLLLSSILLGIGMGGTGVGMHVIISKNTTLKVRKRVFSGLHAMYGISSLVAPFIVIKLISFSFDWATSVLFLALFPLFVLLLSFFMSSNELQEDREDDKKIISPKKVRLVTAGIIGFYVAAEIAISSRLPLYLRSHLNFAKDDAAYYLSLFFIFLLAGRSVFAFINLPTKNFTLLFLSLIASLIAFLIGLYINPLALTFCGFTMSFFFPVAMTFIQENFPDEYVTMTTMALTSMGVMLIIMHWLVGILTDLAGIHFALHLGPVSLVISLILLLLIQLRVVSPLEKKKLNY